LLHDAVDSIPDYGFINNPQQRRKALHNKIDAVENMLIADNFKGALEKLKHDIKPFLRRTRRRAPRRCVPSLREIHTSGTGWCILGEVGFGVTGEVSRNTRRAEAQQI